MDNQEDELRKEVGYKIKSIDQDANNFRVRVQHPDIEETEEVYTFSKNSDWLEEREYVHNGEKRKDPRWKIHVEKEMRKKHESAISGQSFEENSLKQYEGETLDL